MASLMGRHQALGEVVGLHPKIPLESRDIFTATGTNLAPGRGRFGRPTNRDSVSGRWTTR